MIPGRPPSHASTLPVENFPPGAGQLSGRRTGRPSAGRASREAVALIGDLLEEDDQMEGMVVSPRGPGNMEAKVSHTTIPLVTCVTGFRFWQLPGTFANLSAGNRDLI